MVDFDAKDVGKTLGKISQGQAKLQENVYPDDPDAQLLLQIEEAISLSAQGTLAGYLYPTDSFIVDHSVYGEVDSPILQIDGGYLVESQFPLTFPISFATVTTLLGTFN